MGDYQEPTTPCRLCDTPTDMLGTRLCNRCWELESRIHADPELARLILRHLDFEELDRVVRPEVDK